MRPIPGIEPATGTKSNDPKQAHGKGSKVSPPNAKDTNLHSSLKMAENRPLPPNKKLKWSKIDLSQMPSRVREQTNPPSKMTSLMTTRPPESMQRRGSL
jgi:hypothetical protein